MERIGKYLKVIEQHVEPPGKTRRWILLNNAEEHLGWIKWYAPWRQYCFFDALPQRHFKVPRPREQGTQGRPADKKNARSRKVMQK